MLRQEKILVADSEHAVCQVLKTRLTTLGFKVFTVFNGKQVLETLRNEELDLIISEVLLPYVDGYSLCFEIRKYSKIPIILLTSLDTISDRVMGLDLGADDYLTKPFYPKELEARIQSIFRRIEKPRLTQAPLGQEVLRLDTLVINTKKRQVSKQGKKILLTATEFKLLHFLMGNPGKYLSRRLILRHAWGYIPQRIIDNRIVDLYIHRLRSKLEMNPRKPNLILTIRGTGYQFRNFQRRTVNAV